MESREVAIKHKIKKELMVLALPIAVQNLISAAVNSADVLMLGYINQTAMVAVSQAGQITFVLTLFYFALSTGAGILTAQYWGKQDKKAVQCILNISCIFSVSISVLFFIIALSFPGILMKILTNDSSLVAYGSMYLRALAVSYIAMGFSQMYLAVIKSMGNARFSSAVSSIGLILNVVLNGLSIFILFPGSPGKAIIGVAISTVMARVFELLCCIIHSAKETGVRFKLPSFDDEEHKLMKDYLKYTMPVQGNYIIWGCGLTAAATIIGHVNADMVAANSIASVIKNLAIVLCGGISSGGAVVIGRYLGNDDKEIAKEAGDRINLYAVIFGILAGITILVMKPIVFKVANLTENAESYLNGMLYICSYYCIGKSINSTNIGGIFCAGGDSKFGFYCDTIVMWIIVLPLSYLCAFVWHVQPIILYAVISLDEIIKMPIALIRYKKYKWLNNITRDFI